MGFGRDLRAAIFHRVGSFSQREVQHFGAPSLITRDTNDVQQVQMLVLMASTLMVTAPIMMVGGVVMAMREDLGLSWLLLVTIPALLLAIVRDRQPDGARASGSCRSASTRSTGCCASRSPASGWCVPSCASRTRPQRFGVANDELTAWPSGAGRWLALMFPTVMLIINVSSVGVLWFGGHRVDGGQMQVGQLTAFLAYLVQILMAVMMSTFMLMMVPAVAVCADRIGEVLDTETSVVPPAEPRRRAAGARAR